MRYKIETAIKKYKDEDIKNIDEILPKFSKLDKIGIFKGDKRIDSENSRLYSTICFDCLGMGRIENFSNGEITGNEDDKELKGKRRAKRIQNLILSMNEEYRLAYMLYQLLYTDGISYDGNIVFYDEQIQKIMKHDKKYYDYLFETAKKIIQSRGNIKHRITDEFLKIVWETRYEKVKDFSWFDQFGKIHRMSDFKILYVQWLLSGKKIDYSSRFEFQNQLDKSLYRSEIDSFCEEYFRLTNQVESLFSKDMGSDEAKDIQLSVEYLLNTGRVDISSFIHNLSVLSLLRLESILFKVSYNNRNNYLVEVFLTSRILAGFIGEGMVEFYTLKMICGLYDSLYQNEKFIDLFKNNLNRYIDSSNKTIVQYVESIAEKVNGFETISYLMKREIIYRINKMLFY